MVNTQTGDASGDRAFDDVRRVVLAADAALNHSCADLLLHVAVPGHERQVVKVHWFASDIPRSFILG